MDFAERAARNEQMFRGVNERIEESAERQDVVTPLRFLCECARSDCFETIEITPEEYERIARGRYHFMLLPGHEQPQIDRVVERHSAFVVVEKIGEAREQIDRDNPRHRDRD